MTDGGHGFHIPTDPSAPKARNPSRRHRALANRIFLLIYVNVAGTMPRTRIGISSLDTVASRADWFARFYNGRLFD